MKTIIYLLAVILIILAGVYFFVPANSLPSFIPGYDATMTTVRFKHGVAAFVVAIVLLIAGRFVGRR